MLCSILDLDPEKSLSSQNQDKCCGEASDIGLPLKNDPKYCEFNARLHSDIVLYF